MRCIYLCRVSVWLAVLGLPAALPARGQAPGTGGLVAAGSAQAPPAGQWDCVLGGSQQGVAHLFFDAQGSLRGRALFTFTGRSTGVFTNRGILFTNLLGAADLHGDWAYASPGGSNRIVGFINVVMPLAGSANLRTNGLSFRGVLGPSKLTLLSVGYPGEVVWRGIPLAPTNNLGGVYHGTGHKEGAPTPFVEVFVLRPVPAFEEVLTPVLVPYDCSTTNITFNFSTNITVSTTGLGDDCLSTNTTMILSATTNIVITRQACFSTNTVVTTIHHEFPINYYSVEGGGPAYQYTGWFLFSRQNRAAFFQVRGGGAGPVTVYAGPFHPVTGRGSLMGTDGVNRNIKFAIDHGPR